MKKTLRQLLVCILKPRQLMLVALIAGANPAIATIDCTNLNGIWQGSLDKFNAVKLTLNHVSGTARNKSGSIQFIDDKLQNRSYDLGSATCQTRADGASIIFYRNKNGAEVSLSLLITAISGEKMLQVPAFSVRENQKYEKVSGYLTK